MLMQAWWSGEMLTELRTESSDNYPDTHRQERRQIRPLIKE
jgi:hypothetical protein